MKSLQPQHVQLLNSAEHSRMILRKLREELPPEQQRTIDHVCSVLSSAIKGRVQVDARSYERRQA